MLGENKVVHASVNAPASGSRPYLAQMTHYCPRLVYHRWLVAHRRSRVASNLAAHVNLPLLRPAGWDSLWLNAGQWKCEQYRRLALPRLINQVQSNNPRSMAAG